MDVRAEEVQRAAAIAEFLAAGGYFDAQGHPRWPDVPLPQPAQPEQVWIRTLTRPRRWPRKVPRFDALPAELDVPLPLQTTISDQGPGYVDIASAAYHLTHGEFDAVVVARPAATSIAWGLPAARWVLTLSFRYAPDDAARSAILSVLDELPSLADHLIFAWFGPNAIADCLVQSGVTQSYRSVLPQHPITLGLLQAAVLESGAHDPDLLAVLGMDNRQLPHPGWATRHVNALWTGAFPPDLQAFDGMHPAVSSIPSLPVLRSATSQAIGPGQRQGLVRAIATHPQCESLPFAETVALVLMWMTNTRLDDYRSAFAAELRCRDRFASALLRSSVPPSAPIRYVLGHRDSL